MNIINSNKIIAGFIGYEKNEYLWLKHLNHINNLPKCIFDGDNSNSFKFHSSWDWLMVVINEIESTKAEVTIRGTTCNIWHKKQEIESVYIDEPAMTKLEATYLAVVEYIEWYNKAIESTKHNQNHS